MKQILSFYLIMLACALFTFQACRKDVVPTQTQSLSRELTIADARSHFDEKYGIKPPVNYDNFFSRIDTAKQKQPKWDGAQQRVLKSGHTAVVVPLHKQGAYIQVTQKKMARFGFVNYIMMYRDSSGTIVTDWVELKPSESWLLSKIARPYDGNILVRNWDGKLKKIFSYDKGHLLSHNVKRSPHLGPLPMLRTSDDEEPGEDDDPYDDDEEPCFVTQTINVSTTPKKCPCMDHTYEQYDICDCYQKPEPGYNTIVTVTIEIDCPEPPEDPPTGGGGGGSNGGGGSPDPGSGGGGGGGAGGEDYPPLNCNPDPDYEVPTTPPPPGTQYVLPCDELDLPVDDLPGDWGIEFLSPTDQLIAYYNADFDPSKHISTEESDWLYTHPDEVAALLEYMHTETPDVKTFTRWAILYLTQNEGMEFETFRSRYLSRFAEGSDGPMDESGIGYWDDPNLSVPQQVLPGLAQFAAAFPKQSNGAQMPTTNVYNLIGGQVLANKEANPGAFTNACALRISRALNYSGVTIPSKSGQTLKGADNKNYFYRAHELLAWMRRTFPAFLKLTGAQGGENGRNFATYLEDKQGIYIMIPNYPASFGASGHADFWNGVSCIGDCFFNADEGVNAVYFWELN